MTALLITRNLPPLLGGMERLNYHIVLALNESLPFIVIGPGGCSKNLPDSVNVFEAASKPLWRFVLTACVQSVAIAVIKRPGIVFAGSGLTAPLAWVAARLAGAHSVVYLHGLDITAHHPIYRFIWTPFFRRIDTILVNSQNTAKLAGKIGIASNQITVINPGADRPVSSPDGAEVFRKMYALGQRPLLLSVGRFTRRKGLCQFMENVLPGLVEQYPDICLVVIGNEAPDALTGSRQGAGMVLDDLATQLGLSKNLVRLGPCDDITLSAAYHAADVHIFPVIEIPGDVEGFGMVALEAAAHGLPTVTFRTGGIPDAVSHGLSGYLVKAGDYDAMKKRVNDILEKGPRSISPEACRNFAAAHTWNIFKKQLKKTLGLIGRM